MDKGTLKNGGFFSVAIDGPGGAGKSTVAKMVAKRTGFVYIDTGAMYRAVALYGLRRGVDLENEAAVAAYLNDIHIKISYVDGVQHIFLNGEDVTAEIRGREAASGSSKVAAHLRVREKLVALQQQMAQNENIIMDGRDIGMVVLPFANLKIYLV